MPRRTDYDDDWDGDLDSGEEEGEPTVPCPHCHRQVYEDAGRCPYCEQYISREDSPQARKPWWIVLGALVCLYAVYRWIVP
jgi:hypothetical protein